MSASKRLRRRPVAFKLVSVGEAGERVGPEPLSDMPCVAARGEGVVRRGVAGGWRAGGWVGLAAVWGGGRSCGFFGDENRQ